MNVVVIAPHPDDETFGCGGALLRHKANGDSVHWIIVTEMRQDAGYASHVISRRTDEIARVAEMYGFESVHLCHFLTTKLDQTPISSIIQKIAGVFEVVSPSIVYLPNRSDVHTDPMLVSPVVSGFGASLLSVFWSMKHCRKPISTSTEIMHFVQMYMLT